MSRKKPAIVHPVFEIGQRVRLTKPILRYAMMTDTGYVEFPSPVVWYDVGDAGYVLRKSTTMENYWLIYWDDEPPPAGIVVEGFAVHANRLEAI